MEQNKKLTKRMVEECWPLSVGSLARGLLRNTEDGSGKSGIVKLSDRFSSLPLHFRVIQGSLPLVKIKFPKGGRIREQKIPLKTREVGYGDKPFFVCPLCGKIKGKLYLRSDQARFACRECNNLSYELQSINRRGGLLVELQYRLNRALKLEQKRSEIKRLTYNDQVTRKFMSYLIQKNRWLGHEARIEVEQKYALEMQRMS